MSSPYFILSLLTVTFHEEFGQIFKNIALQEKFIENLNKSILPITCLDVNYVDKVGCKMTFKGPSDALNDYKNDIKIRGIQVLDYPKFHRVKKIELGDEEM